MAPERWRGGGGGLGGGGGGVGGEGGGVAKNHIIGFKIFGDLLLSHL